jgi:ABC-type polysaccharide/polyol phosphate transport system ATPase subunit
MPVIKAKSLSKKYRLGVISRKMLVDQIESYVFRKLGKPDPHSKLHEKHTDRMPTPYDFWALQDISFEIQKGDIVGIMGRNGSGKSTLLKLLSRITAPTSGSAEIRGRVASLLEVGTGFHPELTGKENVYLNGSILGLKRQEIDQRYGQIVDFAEIPDFMETPVKRYSSGMRVRLAFAVAAHLDPDVLILDEVLAVGDAAFQKKCLDKIEQTRNSGVTILFVSHSAESVRRLCTRGIVLHEGRLVMDSTAEEAVARYTGGLGGGGTENEICHSVRKSEFLGKVAEILLSKLPEGKLVFDAPVLTEDGIQHIEMGWFSEARFNSVNKEKAFGAAPDICIHLRKDDGVDKALNRRMWLMSRAGATENWNLFPDGRIAVKKNHEFATPLFQGVLKI